MYVSRKPLLVHAVTFSTFLSVTDCLYTLPQLMSNIHRRGGQKVRLLSALFEPPRPSFKNKQRIWNLKQIPGVQMTVLCQCGCYFAPKNRTGNVLNLLSRTEDRARSILVIGWVEILTQTRFVNPCPNFYMGGVKKSLKFGSDFRSQFSLSHQRLEMQQDVWYLKQTLTSRNLR